MIQTPINTAINTSTYTAITVPSGSRCLYAYLSSRAEQDILISDVSAGTTYFTIPAGMSVRLNIEILLDATERSLCYAKAVGGADTLEILLEV